MWNKSISVLKHYLTESNSTMDGLHKLVIFMQVNIEWSYNEGNITSTCTRKMKVWFEYYYYYYFISLEPFLTKLVIYSFHCNFQYQSFTFFYHGLQNSIWSLKGSRNWSPVLGVLVYASYFAVIPQTWCTKFY